LDSFSTVGLRLRFKITEKIDDDTRCGPLQAAHARPLDRKLPYLQVERNYRRSKEGSQWALNFTVSHPWEHRLAYYHDAGLASEIFRHAGGNIGKISSKIFQGYGILGNVLNK